jgi:hypothetical protein
MGKDSYILFLFLFLNLYILVDGQNTGCPNNCSKRGDCGVKNKCTCYSGFTFNDCSGCKFFVIVTSLLLEFEYLYFFVLFLVSCPSGISWFDKASTTNVAHQSIVECSNAGKCDYKVGKCICSAGYTGYACERSSCPNNCNGRGQCLSMLEVSKTDGVPTGSDAVGPIYANWEASKQYMCKCDLGFTGFDCSQSK